MTPHLNGLQESETTSAEEQGDNSNRLHTSKVEYCSTKVNPDLLCRKRKEEGFNGVAVL